MYQGELFLDLLPSVALPCKLVTLASGLLPALRAQHVLGTASALVLGASSALHTHLLPASFQQLASSEQVGMSVFGEQSRIIPPPREIGPPPATHTLQGSMTEAVGNRYGQSVQAS